MELSILSANLLSGATDTVERRDAILGDLNTLEK